MKTLAQITIDVSGWQDAFTTLGPFLGVAAGLALWQLYVVGKIESRPLRTWLLCGSSVLIIVAAGVAILVGFLNL